MSAEQTTEKPARKSIDERVAATIKIGAYIRAAAKFEQASQAFAEACADIRSNIAPSRFVTTVEYKTYLVTIGDNKDFTVEPIEMM